MATTRTEPTFASEITKALGKGLADYAIERQRAQDVGRENALMQYKMQVDQQEQKQRAQERDLNMNLMRIRAAQIEEERRRSALEGYLTPEQKQKYELEQIAARAQAQSQYSTKEVDPTGGLTGDAKNIFLLQGKEAAKQWAIDQKTNKYASEDAYEKYVQKVDAENDRIAKQNIEIQKNNNFAEKFPTVYKRIEPIPVKQALSYSEWSRQQQGRLGTLPLAPTSPAPALPMQAPAQVNPFGGAFSQPQFQAPIDPRQAALEILRKRGLKIGDQQS